MGRFNLWEKIIIENEELENTEFSDEEMESEEDDIIFDLMVSFIINLPEDAVPEDMKVVYNKLISEIGDNYLGGDDEEYETDETDEMIDEEDFDAPMYSDEELKGDEKEEEEED